MRVASLNLFSGRSLSDGQVVPERLAAAVGELAPDVVGLQEVDRDQPRSGHRDLTAEVAAALGAEHWRFVPALTGTPGEQWEPVRDDPGAGDLAGPDGPASGDGAAGGGPAYGCGLVSRLPVQHWHAVRLPSAPVRSPVLVPAPGGRGARPMMLRDEPRVGIAAVVTTPSGGTLTVATTHLSFVPGWNLVQLRTLVRGLAHLPDPLVLLGDLNIPGGLPALALRGWTNLAHGMKTYPAPGPRLQFDHAYARGLRSRGARLPEVARVSTVELPVSDHRALVLDLEG